MALTFAALLPADHVALPWVRVLVAQAFPDLSEHGSHRLADPWRDLLRRLSGLRLLQPGAQPQEARMHQLVQKIVRLHAGEATVAVREQELLAYVSVRAEFLWEGWVRQENRWELVPLMALAWHWLHHGASRGVYLANQAFGSLRNLGHFAETEPLIRRALAIDEQSFGPHHPRVAIHLNNLAALLEVTDRLDEAEQLMRLMLGIFLRSTASTGHEDPFLKTGVRNYVALLADMGRSPAQIIARLNDLARPFGVNFGSGALSEIARQIQKRRTAPWSSIVSGYLDTLMSLFRNAAALLNRKNRVL